MENQKKITPARITEKQEEKVNKAATKVYEILNLAGISRSEFIFVNDEPLFPRNKIWYLD